MNIQKEEMHSANYRARCTELPLPGQECHPPRTSQVLWSRSPTNPVLGDIHGGFTTQA